MTKFGATHSKNHEKNSNKRDFVTADPEQDEVYATIKAAKGDARFDVEIVRTGQQIVAKARTSLSKGKNKARLQIGDIVLIQEGRDGFASYILIKYTDDEIRKLNKMKELVSYKPKTEESSSVIFENEEEIDDEIAEEIDISAI
jgi:translation initiation factor IF-1